VWNKAVPCHLICLIILYIEESNEEIKEETNSVRINEKQAHSVKSADDIVLMAEYENNMNLLAWC